MCYSDTGIERCISCTNFYTYDGCNVMFFRITVRYFDEVLIGVCFHLHTEMIVFWCSHLVVIETG
jgi:hypothetical protein